MDDGQDQQVHVPVVVHVAAHRGEVVARQAPVLPIAAVVPAQVGHLGGGGVAREVRRRRRDARALVPRGNQLAIALGVQVRGPVLPVVGGEARLERTVLVLAAGTAHPQGAEVPAVDRRQQVRPPVAVQVAGRDAPRVAVGQAVLFVRDHDPRARHHARRLGHVREAGRAVPPEQAVGVGRGVSQRRPHPHVEVPVPVDVREGGRVRGDPIVRGARDGADGTQRELAVAVVQHHLGPVAGVGVGGIGVHVDQRQRVQVAVVVDVAPHDGADHPAFPPVPGGQEPRRAGHVLELEPALVAQQEGVADGVAGQVIAAVVISANRQVGAAVAVVVHGPQADAVDVHRAQAGIDRHVREHLRPRGPGRRRPADARREFRARVGGDVRDHVVRGGFIAGRVRVVDRIVDREVRRAEVVDRARVDRRVAATSAATARCQQRQASHAHQGPSTASHRRLKKGPCIVCECGPLVSTTVPLRGAGFREAPAPAVRGGSNQPCREGRRGTFSARMRLRSRASPSTGFRPTWYLRRSRPNWPSRNSASGANRVSAR